MLKILAVHFNTFPALSFAQIAFFTSSHHLLLHSRVCCDCAAVPDAMCQKSSGTCRRAKLFKAHLTASCYKVTLKKYVLLLVSVQVLIFTQFYVKGKIG